jgi:hypothetical protein
MDKSSEQYQTQSKFEHYPPPELGISARNVVALRYVVIP